MTTNNFLKILCISLLLTACGKSSHLIQKELSNDPDYNKSKYIAVVDRDPTKTKHFTENYTILKKLEKELCGGGGTAKLQYGASRSNAMTEFRLIAYKTNADAVIDFTCTQPKMSMDSIKSKCLTNFKCSALAVKRK